VLIDRRFDLYLTRCYKEPVPHEVEMSIDPKLLEILACPICKTEVRLTADGQGLLCRSCRRRYAIVDDIPIMLAEEASIEPEEGAEETAGPRTTS
jgi:uncharacterized protein YbaR (Trm112 family)